MNLSCKVISQAQKKNNNIVEHGFLEVRTMGEQIPKIIHQVFLQQQLPKIFQQNIDTMKSMNPEWEFRLYDDVDIINFIKSEFPNLLAIYNKINPIYGAAKVDFFRYLIIYFYGGLYLDIKSSLEIPLDQVIKVTDKYLLSHWANKPGETYENWGMYDDLPNQNGEFQQWHIAAVEGHPFLKNVIENVCTNIINYNPFKSETGQLGIYKATGPIAYTLAILPLLHQFTVTLARSNLEFGFIYSIFGDGTVSGHRLFFKNHHTQLDEPITRMSFLGSKIFRLFKIINKKKSSISRKIRYFF